MLQSVIGVPPLSRMTREFLRESGYALIRCPCGRLSLGDERDAVRTVQSADLLSTKMQTARKCNERV